MSDDDQDEIVAQSSQSGFVYCMTNEAMPGIVKIGITVNLEKRQAKLFSTAVPFPFVVEFAKFVDRSTGLTPRQAEAYLQTAFVLHRVNSKREFFKVPVDSVRSVFLMMLHHQKDVKLEHRNPEGELMNVPACC